MRDNLKRERKIKIIATLGPSSEKPETIEALIKAGVDCFRIDFSHVGRVGFRDYVQAVRDSSARLSVHIPILADIQGPNISRTRHSVETLSDKDVQDLETIRTVGLDIVAISNVPSATKIHHARRILGNSRIQIMAKVEITEALDNLDSILEVSDGVMATRGDLEVELDFEKIAMLQKRVISKASGRGKWVAVATQMLGSMALNRRPSRAEVSDVANAVLDGVDALMLFKETATGENPEEAVKAMAQIILESETKGEEAKPLLDENIRSFSAGATEAAIKAAKRMNAKAIIAMAGSGLSTLLISKWKPEVPIVGLSAKKETLQRLNILRGVIPLQLQSKMDFESQLRIAEEFLMVEGFAVPGDIIVAITSFPFAIGSESNTVHIHKLAS
jgi:pyruvate kinase